MNDSQHPPLATSSAPPKPDMLTVHVRCDEISTAYDAAQIISRLPYLEALKLATFCEGDVDKIVDGALAFLMSEQSDAS